MNPIATLSKGGVDLNQGKEYGSLAGISDQEAEELCQALRQRVIQVVSQTGGHLASNLGAVELTVALHRVYDTSKDRLVFDVGHQCYVHKMLTGRNGRMETLRAFGGIAGFPKPSESKHDACIAGHASTAVSTALGMAIARTQLGENYRVVALLGDGSLTGGLAYEGLSMAGQSGEPLVVILNDNGMSINASMGGVAQHLAKQRLKPQYLWAKEIYRKVMHATPPGRALHRAIHRIKEGIKASLLPCSMFENMGFQYMGPVDGHDVKGLTHLLRYASTVEGPVLLHVKTVKGKGFRPAEKNPDDFHGIGPFQKESGALSQGSSGESFSARFGRDLRELARKDPRICAVTAAMTAGTGLTDFAKEFPQRFFDVGIAEEHAVTFAAGLATSGLVPVVAIYSSFLQRAYDQILHDVCLQKLHVIFAIDRSGLVGADGDTHQGIFDTAFLSHIPNMTIIAPKNRYELTRAMEWAVAYDGPVALKYSRGEAYYGLKEYNADIEYGRSEMIHRGQKLAIVAVGNMVQEAEKVYDRLLADGTNVTFVNARFLKPIDTDMIDELSRDHEHIVVIEEEIKHGGYGSLVEEYVMDRHLDVDVTVCAIEDTFVQHGSVEELRRMLKLDADSLYDRIKHIISTDCTE